MKLKGGRVATGGQLRSVIESHAGPSILRAGLAVQGGIQKASPVKTGTLRRSWSVSALQWQGSRVYVRVGTTLVYARYQNTRTVNSGYIERGYEGARAQAKGLVEQGMKSLGDALWVK